ncbi:MAG: DUF559 domain-containing protein [Legionellales bacterium]|nr:DUF559 domain-containing protein [Legionellales bacterium]
MDDAQLRQYARELRKNSTDSESRLWFFLRASRLRFKFKRQVPIKRFIVDFVCHWTNTDLKLRARARERALAR